jgi:DNA-binding LacI/PurR family transcriptional regulator
VAEQAGVSVKTVSRVINKQGEISDETRSRVSKVIEQLGYRPNTLARGLVSGKSATVALIIPQISDPFFPEVMQGVEAVARLHGYNVFLCNTEDDPEQELEYVNLLAGKRVDGVILCGSRLTAEQLEKVARQHRVSILSSRNPPGSALISIPGDRGLYLTTQHLAQLGHRRIGHLGSGTADEHERLVGYERAMEEAGLSIDPRWVERMPRVTIETSYVAAKRLLNASPELSAISCYNDLAAVGVLQAAAELGRRVPDDLAVTGFDDIPLASLVSPSLTTIHVPRYQLGQRVMELLLRVINANGAVEERETVEIDLVVRRSSGGAI